MPSIPGITTPGADAGPTDTPSTLTKEESAPTNALDGQDEVPSSRKRTLHSRPHTHDQSTNNYEPEHETYSAPDFDGSAHSAYEPLPKGAIRLLNLLPGGKDEAVYCEPSIINLESRPAYQTLSYAWGSPNQVKIFLNGDPCSIGHNLLACLRKLRHEDSARVLLVDAICIN
jgi:hypothetical protein